MQSKQNILYTLYVKIKTCLLHFYYTYFVVTNSKVLLIVVSVSQLVVLSERMCHYKSVIQFEEKLKSNLITFFVINGSIKK